jgi:hypothetical protein
MMQCLPWRANRNASQSREILHPLGLWFRSHTCKVLSVCWEFDLHTHTSSDDANANIPIMISSMARITHTHLWLTHTHTQSWFLQRHASHTHTSLTHTHSHTHAWFREKRYIQITGLSHTHTYLTRTHIWHTHTFDSVSKPTCWQGGNAFKVWSV